LAGEFEQMDVDLAFLDELRARVDGGSTQYPFLPFDRDTAKRLFVEVDKIESAMIAARATTIRLTRSLEEAMEDNRKMSSILAALDIDPGLWCGEASLQRLEAAAMLADTLDSIRDAKEEQQVPADFADSIPLLEA
jgi:hypothetical protein